MANDSIFLTTEEVSSLQEAVGRIVDTGLRIQDTERRIPAGADEEITILDPCAGDAQYPQPSVIESSFPQQTD
jgi:hypothetical protein